MNILNKVFKFIVIVVVAIVISFAVLISAARALTPFLDHQRDFFATWAGHVLHRTVTIGSISASWYRFNPIFQFHDVVIKDSEEKYEAIHVKRLDIAIDSWHSLLNRTLLPGDLTISGAYFKIVQNSQETPNYSKLKYFVELATQAQVTVDHLDIDFYTQKNQEIKLRNLQIIGIDRHSKHQFLGKGQFVATQSSPFYFVIDKLNEDSNIEKTNIDFYGQIKNLNLVDLNLFNAQNGKAGAKIWAKFRGGQLISAQSTIKIKDYQAYFPEKKITTSIHRLSSNLFWQKNSDGWSLLADKTQVLMGKHAWPENRITINVRDNPQGKEWSLNADYFCLQDVEPFLQGFNAFPTLNQWQGLQGDFHDIQLGMNQDKKAFFSAKFSDVTLYPRDSGLMATELNGSVVMHDALGNLTLSRGTLSLKNSHSTLSNINGVFSLSRASIAGKNIYAQLNGEPVLLSIGMEKNSKNIPVLAIHCQGVFSIPPMNYVSGMANYEAILYLNNIKNMKDNTLIIRSNSKGVVIHLPPPFGKSAQSPRAFHAVLHFVSDHEWDVDSQYGLTRGRFLLTHQPQLKLLKGHIHIGKGNFALSQQPGLTITGNIDKFNVSLWSPYFQSSSSSSFPPILIESIDLHIHQLIALSREWHNTQIYLAPVSGGWSVSIDNSAIKGKIIVPHDHRQLWMMNFSYLRWPKSENSNQKSIDPGKIPPLRIHSENTWYGDQDLGRVYFESQSESNIMKIKHLLIATRYFHMDAVGEWTSYYKKWRGKLTTSDLGLLLKQYHITQALEGSKGSADFDLEWPALNGRVNIEFRDGRIVQLNSKTESELGVGRLLGVLSLQSWSKQLSHGISGAQEGFVFSLLKGDFTLKNSEAITQNTSLVGPLAWVQVKGLVGVRKKNYDLYFDVIPNVTSSLPTIVSFLGGPIAGGVAWAVHEVFGKEMGKMAEFSYHVTGTWMKPSVAQLPSPKNTM